MLGRYKLMAAGLVAVLSVSCKAPRKGENVENSAGFGSPSAAAGIAGLPPGGWQTTASGAPPPSLALHISRPSAPLPPPEDVPVMPESPTPAPVAPEASDLAESFSAEGAESVATMRVRTTAYARDEIDHFTFGSMSAMGKPLSARGPLRSAAADWSRFPAGTVFKIAGQPDLYRIDDYGSALVGTDTIDLYQPDEFAMEDWGVRHVDIEVLRWGSHAQSLKILQGRTGHDHVDKMVTALETRHIQPGGEE